MAAVGAHKAPLAVSVTLGSLARTCAASQSSSPAGANQYALENVSIKIENGSHLAVVGRNGSGKTTFIKLMCRLYDVTDGEILINGENIQAYTKESITALYSVVFQDFKIFSVPLRDTVCAGSAFDRDKLYTCLENANIKERVECLPHQENTYLYKDLNKGGVEISAALLPRQRRKRRIWTVCWTP